MPKRFLSTGAVIILFIGVFITAMISGTYPSQIMQEELPVLLEEREKSRLANIFVEKMKYTYDYYLWFDGEDLGFKDKGYCGENLEVVLYWKDGVYYFMPLADCNGEVKSGTDLRKAKIDVKSEQCVFHKLWQEGGLKRDFGVWGLYGNVSIPLDRVAMYAYLGIVEIDVTGDSPPQTPPLERNEYIDAAVDALRKDGNQGELPEGRYRIYIGLYEYSEDAEQVVMTGVMERRKSSGREEYRWFRSTVVRNPDGSYDARCGSAVGADEKYPTMELTAADKVEHIVEARRLVTYMVVDWDDIDFLMIDILDRLVSYIEADWEGEKMARQEAAADMGMNDDADENLCEEIMQPQITLEEAQKWMEALYFYYQWFYVDMPYDIDNLLEEGETYSVYTDGNGDIFWLKKDGVAKRTRQDCYGGICRPEVQTEEKDLPVYHAKMGIFYRQQAQLQEIGTMTWHKPDCQKLELPALAEDEFIRAVRDYIQNELLPEGENGAYQLVIGRYEILTGDVRAISAAVTGSETYYLYCLVTKYSDGTYGCFPAGGSYAGEWESGKEKVRRIVELDRLRIPLSGSET